MRRTVAKIICVFLMVIIPLIVYLEAMSCGIPPLGQVILMFSIPYVCMRGIVFPLLERYVETERFLNELKEAEELPE